MFFICSRAMLGFARVERVELIRSAGRLRDFIQRARGLQDRRAVLVVKYYNGLQYIGFRVYIDH